MVTVTFYNKLFQLGRNRENGGVEIANGIIVNLFSFPDAVVYLIYQANKLRPYQGFCQLA
jgi:hypothetical protein